MKISVVTAVYNSKTTVAEAIASVAAQSYPDVEHLIIEGKSKDGSLAVIEAASHDRMVLVSESDKGNRLERLGWRASTPLDQGIAETYCWFLDNAGTFRTK